MPLPADAGFDAVTFVGLGFGVAAGDGADGDQQARAQDQFPQHKRFSFSGSCRPGKPLCNPAQAGAGTGEMCSRGASIASATFTLVRLSPPFLLLFLRPRVLDREDLV